MTTNDKTNPTNVSGNTEGQAILTNPTPKLHLKLSAVDMNSANKGKTYYATNDINKNYDTEETKRSIAIASVASITLPVVYKITGSNEEKIEAIMLINNRETDQINLAGKQVNINITNSSFKCEVVSEFIDPMTPDDIIKNPIPGVVESTGVVEDELAVRYYGTNPDNYICFGTNDKDTCINDTDKYMYRIIGVDKSGRFKLIKKEALNTAYYWHNVYNQDIKWNQSDLYKGLNGISGGTYSNLFIGNSYYVPKDWENKIETINWKYGNIADSTSGANQAASGVVKVEQGWTTTTSSKIGLMYMADYYFGTRKTGTNCNYNSSSTYPTCKTSWMHISNNDSAPPHSYEWTMSRYGRNSNGNYNAWFVRSSGSVDWNGFVTEHSVRPVFYLTSNTIIKSGTGTINDPYIIK